MYYKWYNENFEQLYICIVEINEESDVAIQVQRTANNKMSIVQNPIMGQMRKSFANVNTYVYRGQNVISAKSFNRKNSNTEAQQVHRASFKLISDAAQMLGGFLERGFPVRQKKLSAYNLFMQLNLPGAIDTSGEVPVIDYSLLQVSRGTLIVVMPVSASFDGGVLLLTVATNIEFPNTNATDRIQLLVGTTKGNVFAMQQERGSEATVNLSINLPNVLKEDISFVYLFVNQSDGKKASNSVFVLPE